MSNTQKHIIILSNDTLMTHREIAHEVGCARSYVTRTVNEYKRNAFPALPYLPPLSDVALHVSRWYAEILTLPSRINTGLQERRMAA